MERFLIRIGKLIAVLATFTVLPFTLAQDSIYMGEDYYGNNIDGAILEAKQNIRQLDYLQLYWYNRTTVRSFPLPKMKKDAMEKESLEGALGATASGGRVENDGPYLAIKNPREFPEEELNPTAHTTLKQPPHVEIKKFDPASIYTATEGTDFGLVNVRGANGHDSTFTVTNRR